MAALRSEEIMLDHEAVARALKAPRAPQFASGRPKYSLEDRLPGVGTLGSMMPPTPRQLEAMRPTLSPPPRSMSSSLAFFLIFVVATLTCLVTYRVVHHEATAPAAAAASE